MAGSRPARYAARPAICAFVVVLGAWNALRYPPGFGYDAAAHMAYADGLVPGGRLPHGTGEFHIPPGYYAVAGSLDWVARKLGAGEPHRAGMAVNVLFLLGTVLLVVAARARALARADAARASRRSRSRRSCR